MTPNGYTNEEVKQLFDRFKKGRAQYDKIWKQLDAYDSGRFWEHMRKKLPKHQIITDSNYINYIKRNYTNSLYAAPYIADISARYFQHKEHADQVNMFYEYIYNKLNIPMKQLQAGDRAALNNVGYIQFGWDNDVIDMITERYKGDVVATVQDTLAVYLDPSYRDLQKGKAVFIEGEESLIELMRKYPEEMRAYSEAVKDNYGTNHSLTDAGKGYLGDYSSSPQEGMVRTVTAFFKHTDSEQRTRIDQLFYVGNDFHLIDIKEGIKPNYFPIVPLYGLPPVKDPYGMSECALVLKNVLTINLLDSITATHTYAAQKRATIISANSGLDPRTVSANINNPNKILVTTGDVNNVVNQLDLPELPRDLPMFREHLMEMVHMVTGVDLRYTGRDTGSVTTTGGMEALQTRMGMTDNTRIFMLEQFAKNVAKMIIDFYVEFGKKREVNLTHKNPVHNQLYKIDFDVFKKDDEGIRFDYTINSSPYLPKNRARLAEAANIIMEKQMQYQMNPPLMTSEEWLEYQDFPQKDLMLARMRAEQLQQDHEDIQNTVVDFSSLVQQGVSPEGATNMLAQEKQARRDNPKLGNTGGAGSFQNAQMGGMM